MLRGASVRDVDTDRPRTRAEFPGAIRRAGVSLSRASSSVI